MGFSDSHHFRKMIAGVCMVVGPLLALASFVVSPALHTKVAAQLGSYAAHPDRTLLSVLFGIAAVAFVIVATLGLMHMLRERMVSYGNVGGGMALLGLVLAMASMGVGFVFGIGGSAIFLVGLGSIGAMIMRETDAEWEHTPEYHGFRAATGVS